MRFSRLHAPTLKETPAEAEIPSHRLMLRAALVRKLTSGTYSYLPLGWRSLHKAVAIVREEMDRAGAQEVLLPALHPIELWSETGRDALLGEVLIKFRDRHGRVNALGPTHEEVVVDLVRGEIKSYKQLPVNLYQIQTKFRDEPRPRSGVLRSREFIMKDAYSFDADAAGLARSYAAMYAAYARIFARCGIETIPVEAESGAIGGEVNHEFMVPSPSGEDRLVRCNACGYAANLERAECPPVARTTEPPRGEAREVATPGASSVEAVTRFLEVASRDLVKTLICMSDAGPVAALVRGDHELNEAKLARLAPGARAATAEEVERITNAPVGFAGPVGLKGVRLLADHSVAACANFVVGANKDEAHLVDVSLGRDFEPEDFFDLKVATGEEPCPHCGAALDLVSAIEIGHVFQLGVKYSAAMKATFLDENGKAKPFLMGCYGIGVNRILASAIELAHDADGIAWPVSIAPYEVALVAAGSKGGVTEAAESLYEELGARGIEVLFDDRNIRPGVKFKDADLLGLPLRAVVGEKSLAAGRVELRLRATGELEKVPVAEAADRIAQRVRDLRADLEAAADRAGKEAAEKIGAS